MTPHKFVRMFRAMCGLLCRTSRCSRSVRFRHHTSAGIPRKHLSKTRTEARPDDVSSSCSHRSDTISTRRRSPTGSGQATGIEGHPRSGEANPEALLGGHGVANPGSSRGLARRAASSREAATSPAPVIRYRRRNGRPSSAASCGSSHRDSNSPAFSIRLSAL